MFPKESLPCLLKAHSLILLCFHPPSSVSFPSVYKHIQMSLLNKTTLTQFSLSNLHTITFLIFDNKPQERTHTPIFSVSSNFIHYSFTTLCTVHYPPHPNLQIKFLKYFLSQLTRAALPQSAELQISYPQNPFFFIVGLLDAAQV